MAKQKAGPRMRRARRHMRNVIVPAILMTLSMLVLVAILDYVNYDLITGIGASAIIFASFAGSAFLMFIMPRSHAANLWRFGKSYLISGVLGSLGYYLIPAFGVYAAIGVVLFVAVLAQVATDSEHPPALSLAFAFLLYKVSYTGLIVVVIGAAVMILIRVFLEKAVYVVEGDIEKAGHGLGKAAK